MKSYVFLRYSEKQAELQIYTAAAYSATGLGMGILEKRSMISHYKTNYSTYLFSVA